MATCELCGATYETLQAVKVTGATMMVCNNCKSHGKSMELEQERSHHFRRHSATTRIEEEVVSDYAKLIQKAMTKKGWNLHQLARAASIKESSIKNYLLSKLKPDLQTAKQLEKTLDISLTQEASSSGETQSFSSEKDEAPLTLGDMLLKQLEKEKSKKL
ncbi:TIGR00270 family protein [Candidatus Woesearchaeota archaeon]|nr:TIGR00270 family protein [Nanoarchaeota archaeon]MCB9371034.1 TIGR00270 family protein [Candidatus Woesearchaeota archaeon]USN44248.1 MAG: TIGR00270 family protein [Candidatus Woesearchaeota archaeon]